MKTKSISPPASVISITPSSTERSVVSPFRPQKESWTSRDIQTVHPPANVRQALQVTPTNLQLPVQQVPVQIQQQPAANEPRPSLKKRFVLGLGALAAIAVIPGAVVGTVTLGPIGLVLGVGLGVLSGALIGIGNRMK